MTEHTFAASDPDDAQATRQALELTEAILEELSRANHDWHAIDRMASALAQTTSAMAGVEDPAPRSAHPES